MKDKKKSVIGYITYDVRVACPHCENILHLNQYPYDSDETEYHSTEDELGLALFGGPNTPATWHGISVEYKCCACEEVFCIGSLEI